MSYIDQITYWPEGSDLEDLPIEKNRSAELWREWFLVEMAVGGHLNLGKWAEFVDLGSLVHYRYDGDHHMFWVAMCRFFFGWTIQECKHRRLVPQFTQRSEGSNEQD